MTALEMLPAATGDAVAEIVATLAGVPGVVAIALGGSWARGKAKADSDVDLGLYYREERPFLTDDVRQVAARFASSAPTVTGFYEWGPWVNGGAWLDTRVGRVDFLYRGLAHVTRVIAAARQGEVEWHFGQQPPYGFRNVIYLAETKICVALHDPDGELARLKQSVVEYPEALRLAIVRSSLWGAEFTLFNGRKLAARADVYAIAGCLTRAACELTQVLYALNRQYFIGDQGALQEIESFPLRPAGYASEIASLLGDVGANAVQLRASIERMARVVADVVELAAGMYEAKFGLPSR